MAESERSSIPNAKTDLGLEQGSIITIQAIVTYPGSVLTDLVVPGVEGVVQIPNDMLAMALAATKDQGNG